MDQSILCLIVIAFLEGKTSLKVLEKGFSSVYISRSSGGALMPPDLSSILKVL